MQEFPPMIFTEGELNPAYNTLGKILNALAQKRNAKIKRTAYVDDWNKAEFHHAVHKIPFERWTPWLLGDSLPEYIREYFAQTFFLYVRNPYVRQGVFDPSAYHKVIRMHRNEYSMSVIEAWTVLYCAVAQPVAEVPRRIQRALDYIDTSAILLALQTINPDVISDRTFDQIFKKVKRSNKPKKGLRQYIPFLWFM